MSHFRHALSLLLVLAMVMALSIPATADETTVTLGSLSVNYQIDPLGVETERPIRFSWNMRSFHIGQEQKTYQIDVTDPSGALVWSSGKVESAESVGVAYSVDGLEKSSRYNWAVTVDTADGRTVTSAPATFVTDTDMSGAQWIIPVQESGSMPLLRTEQALTSEVESATLAIAALGSYTAYINGIEVMNGAVNDILAPGWTDYNAYVNYQTYDVSEILNADRFALGIALGKGWYAGKISAEGGYAVDIGFEDKNELAVIAQLVIHYADGTQLVVSTNETDWKSSDYSPVLANDLFDGETYDANIADAIDGWNNIGFDAANWSGVTAGSYIGQLHSSSKAVPRIAEELTRFPVYAYTYNDAETQPASAVGNAYGAVVAHEVDLSSQISLRSGDKLIVDFGQNAAGVVELTMAGTQGTVVTINYAEMLNDGRSNPNSADGGSDGPEGTLYTKAITNAEAQDRYIMNADETQTWAALDTYHGFRYAQIQSNEDVVLTDIHGLVFTAVGDQTGTLETNDVDINRLVSNTRWSQVSNYLSVPTDCPQRGERAGWTGDAQLFAATGVYNYDVYAFLESYNELMQTYAASHGNTYGAIMPTAFFGWFATSVSSGWSDAGIIIPWVLYQQTGDATLIRQYYEQMDAYMDYVAENGYHVELFGDWLGTSPASTPIMNAIYQVYTTQIMQKMATVIGNQEMEEKYAARYDALKAAYIEKYVDDAGNVLSATADNATTTFHGYTIIDNAQTALLWTLKCGLYDTDAQRDTMIENLLANVRNEGGKIREGAAENTLSVGFLGVNVILPVLTEIGAIDTAYDLMLQTEMPSWLYSVKNGATTIWERWNSYSVTDSFGDAGMNSFNHYSYGACLEWMYKYMSGISMDEAIPGFKHIILQPTVDASGRINTVKGTYTSLYGQIVSDWISADGNLMSYHAEIPANTTATLYLPVDEDAASEIRCDGVSFTGMTNRFGIEVAQFELLSGGYDFSFGETASVTLSEGYTAE